MTDASDPIAARAGSSALIGRSHQIASSHPTISTRTTTAAMNLIGPREGPPSRLRQRISTDPAAVIARRIPYAGWPWRTAPVSVSTAQPASRSPMMASSREIRVTRPAAGRSGSRAAMVAGAHSARGWAPSRTASAECVDVVIDSARRAQSARSRLPVPLGCRRVSSDRRRGNRAHAHHHEDSRILGSRRRAGRRAHRQPQQPRRTSRRSSRYLTPGTRRASRPGLGASVYSGSRTSGAVWKGDLRTGNGNVLVPPHAGQGRARAEVLARAAVRGRWADRRGLRLRRADRVPTSPPTSSPPAASFINDVVVTRDAAYFTDSHERRLLSAQAEEGRPCGRPGHAPAARATGSRSPMRSTPTASRPPPTASGC